jgi:hypothetical protein
MTGCYSNAELFVRERRCQQPNVGCHFLDQAA